MVLIMFAVQVVAVEQVDGQPEVEMKIMTKAQKTSHVAGEQKST